MTNGFNPQPARVPAPDFDRRLTDARMRAAARGVMLTTSAFALAACNIGGGGGGGGGLGGGGGGGGDPVLDDPMTFFLTAAKDVFTGGNNDDFFDGSLSANGGFQTLNSPDQLDGGDGDDVLEASYTEPTTPVVTDIERFELTDADAGGELLNFISVTGLQELELIGMSGPADIININQLLDLELTSNTQDVSIDYIEAAVIGGATRQDILLTAHTSGDISLDPGIEIVDLVSEGPVPNMITGLFAPGATSLVLDGARDLMILGNLPSAMQTINATALTGDLALTQTNPGTLDFQGGPGDVTLFLGDGFDDTDTVNGGGGTNTLIVGASSLAAINNPSNVTNFASVEVEADDPLTADLDLTLFAQLNTIALLGGIDGPVELTLSSGDEVTLGDETTGILTISIDPDGASDEVTLILDGADADIRDTILATDVETLRFEVRSDPGETSLIEIDDDITLAINGVQRVFFSGDAEVIVGGDIRADIVDASGMSAPIEFNGSETTNSEFIGGSAADRFLMNDGIASDLTGGGGGDQFVFDVDAADEMTGGPGADLFTMEDYSGGANYTSGTNFAAVQINDFSSGDILQLSLSTLAERFTGLITGGDAAVDTTSDLAPITFATIDEANETLNSGDILLLTGVTYANEAAVLADLQDTGNGRGFTLAAGDLGGDTLIVAYQTTGGDTALALVHEEPAAPGGPSSAELDVIDTFLTLSGVAVDTLPTFDVEIIA